MSNKQYFISQLFVDIQLKQGKGKRIDPCAKLSCSSLAEAGLCPVVPTMKWEWEGGPFS